MELWDLYTEDRTPTGKTHVRGEKVPAGCYHLVVHVWIQNGRGEYLISQRSASRPAWPLMWECVGGSVVAGETSLEGAVREVKEEVGLDLEPSGGELVRSCVRADSLLDVWHFRYDGDVSLENATTDEVAQVKWMTPAQIRGLLESHKLVDTLAYFFTKVNLTGKGCDCCHDLSRQFRHHQALPRGRGGYDQRADGELGQPQRPV